MMKVHSAFSKDATSIPAASVDLPRNWRSELGTSWRDIEEAGSLARAIRLRSPAVYVKSKDSGAEIPNGGDSSVRASRWAYFRTICSGML